MTEAGLSGAAQSMVSFGMAFQTALPWIAGIAAAISLVAVGIKNYKDAHPSLESLQKDAEAAKNEFNEMEQKVKDTSDKIEELNKLKEQNLLTTAESEELEYLERQNEIYTAQRDLLKEIADYKEQQAKDEASRAASQELQNFLSYTNRNLARANPDRAEGMARRAIEANRDGYAGLLNALDDYAAAQEKLDSLNKELTDSGLEAKEESKQLSEEEAKALQETRDNIADANKELTKQKGVLVRFKESLVGILGDLTDEEDIAQVESLIAMIDNTGAFDDASDGLKTFQKGFNEIGDDADAVIKKFLKGEKLTESESKRLIQTLDKMGVSTEDAAIYFARMAEEMHIDAPSIDTSKTISDLLGLRDELQKTTADIEAYNKALEGGEKGDAAETYKSAWEKAREDIKSGKNDTRAVHAAASLIFGEDQLAAWNYESDVITKQLKSNKMLKAVLGGDGDIGLNFGNYLRDNAKQYAGLVDVMKNGDGSFDIAIHDFEGLANAMGVSEGFVYALADALDAYGPQQMMDSADLAELHGRFNEMNGDVGQLIKTLAGEGMDGMDIVSALHQLDDAFGDFDFDESIYQQVADAMKSLEEGGKDGEENNVDISTDVEDPTPQVAAYIKQLQELADANPIEFKSTFGDGSGEDKSATSESYGTPVSENPNQPGVRDAERAAAAERRRAAAEAIETAGKLAEAWLTAEDSVKRYTAALDEDNDGDLYGNYNSLKEAKDAAALAEKEYRDFMSDNGLTGIGPAQSSIAAKYAKDLAEASDKVSDLTKAQADLYESGASMSEIQDTAEDIIQANATLHAIESGLGVDKSFVVDVEADTDEAKGEIDDLNDEEVEVKATVNKDELQESLENASGGGDGWMMDRLSLESPTGGGADRTVNTQTVQPSVEATSNAEEVAAEATAALESVPSVAPSISAIDGTSAGVSSAQANLSSLPSKVVIPVIVAYSTSGKLPSLAGHATGTKDAPGGPTLVNELGPELISENGRAYIAGGGLPTVVNLSPGAIVLTAEDTKKALAGKKSVEGVIDAAAKGSSNTKDKYRMAPFVEIGTKDNHTRYYVLTGNNERAVLMPQYGTTNATVNTGTNKPSRGGGGGRGRGGGGGGTPAKDDREKVDWIEVALDRLNRTIDSLNNVFESAFKTLSARMQASTQEMAKIREGFDTNQKGYDRYIQEANSVGLREDIAKLVREGTIDISKYDKDTKSKIDEYKQWYEKALDCKEAIDALHESLAQLYLDRFDSVQKDYESQLDMLEHQAKMVEADLDMVETRGYLGNASFYQTLADNEAQSIERLKSELADLTKYFNEAMSSGEIQANSEAWYEMQDSINSVKEEIAEANVQLVEYQNNIRDLNWEYFDYVHEQFGKLIDEANFFIDLMHNDELYDDRGQLSSAGMATMGMHVLDYNAYMAQADDYAKEMQKIEREIASDPYNTKLIERREELLDLQRDSILAAENEKDAIKDLVSDGIDKELDALKELIDTYTDSLDSAKDLYEYQKKVTEKTSDIASLQKQLSAYTNDTSEETRAKVQKLNKDLADAQKELREAEQDQSIDEQKKLLDDLYNEYEELLNERLDNIDALVADMITETNANLVDIRTELETASEKVGYTITDAMKSTIYGQKFANYDGGFEELSTVSQTLDEIHSTVVAMARVSGAIKAYASGGIVDYTGLASVHGTPGKPELMLNATDTANFLAAASMLRQTPVLSALSAKNFGISGSGFSAGGVTIGSIDLGGIQIDHVQDYNDMLAQMRDDPKFEKLISVMTLDTAVGKSSFRKNSIKF